MADTFAEADRIMTPLLGRPLSDFIFVDADDPATVSQLEYQLLQTEITQPAVLAADTALTRLLEAYGITPDMVIGHSLGEYGALVRAGTLTFEEALEAVSARGRGMANLNMSDNGAMAAVIAPLTEIQRFVDGADGNVVMANVNSNKQAVIGGATAAVETLVAQLQQAGHTAIRLPVSHAFHTSIVAPASEPLKAALRGLDVRPPVLPLVANVDGEFYPTGPDAPEKIVDILGRQVASPVQFVKGLHTLYAAGARVFVETGPKKALHGFAEDVITSVHDDAVALFTNHPKSGDVVAFNQALCGLYAAGHGTAADAVAAPASVTATPVNAAAARHRPAGTVPRPRRSTPPRRHRSRPPRRLPARGPRCRLPGPPRDHRPTAGSPNSGTSSPTLSNTASPCPPERRPAVTSSSRPPMNRSSSPARRSACPAPSVCSTTRTSAGSSAGSSSSAPSHNGSAATCSTSTSSGSSRTRTGRAAS